jgi:hypothetical protein
MGLRQGVPELSQAGKIALPGGLTRPSDLTRKRWKRNLAPIKSNEGRGALRRQKGQGMSSRERQGQAEFLRPLIAAAALIGVFGTSTPPLRKSVR